MKEWNKLPIRIYYKSLKEDKQWPVTYAIPFFPMTCQVCCCVINIYWDDSYGLWIFSSTLPQLFHIVSSSVFSFFRVRVLISVFCCCLHLCPSVCTHLNHRDCSSLSSLNHPLSPTMGTKIMSCFFILFSPLCIHVTYGFSLKINTKTRGWLKLNICWFIVDDRIENIQKK